MNRYRFFIESYGCQMNAYDTEVVSSMLEGMGHRSVEDPGDADVIIVNTCSVREHAEARALGRLHDLSRYRDSVFVVCGCMAKRMGETLLDRVPAVDIVAGPDTYDDLPTAIERVIGDGGKICLLDTDSTVTYRLGKPQASLTPARYVSITRGCDNYCSYCIVPYLRGSVRSKDPEQVIEEISTLVDEGTLEITLLGQNVMSYRHGKLDFPGLVKRVVAETNLRRLRFLTTHPRDINLEIFEIMAENPVVCPHIHLPVQAGSDRILNLMGRGYDRDGYLSVIEEARRIKPDLAVTTDIIIGFPSETDAEFEQTLDLVERIRFDAAFTFKYSTRDGTEAARMEDDIPQAVKKDRLRLLNEAIGRIRLEILSSRIGEHAEIILDGEVQKGEDRFMKGRTPHFRNVLIRAGSENIGDVLYVTLSKLRNYTYIGEALARR